MSLHASAVSADLIAAHNLTEANLRHVHKMGGLAAPSLAVTRAAFLPKQYGEITLLAPMALVDPRKGAKLFAADIYSSRYPTVEREIDRAAMDRLAKRLEPTCQALGISELLSHNDLAKDGEDYLEQHLAVVHDFLQAKGIDAQPVWVETMSAERVARLQTVGLGIYLQETQADRLQSDPRFCELAVAEYRDALQRAAATRRGAALLKELDEDPSYRQHIAHETARSIVQSAQRRMKPELAISDTRHRWSCLVSDLGLRDELREHVQGLLQPLTVGERIFVGFTYTGRRRYVPHTLESVVKIMKKALQGGENFNYGVGNIRAHFAPSIRSLKALQSHADSLVSAEDFDAYKSQINRRCIELSESIDPQMDTQTFADILIDSARMGLPSALRLYGKKASDEQLQTLQAFIDHLREAPTSYFEAKLMRPVGLGEFSGAIVPTQASAKTMAILEEAQLDIWTYTFRDEASRQAALAQALQGAKEGQSPQLDEEGVAPGETHLASSSAH